MRKVDTNVTHSKRGSTENATELVVDAELTIGDQKYRSNWVVADCRYDFMLGMPWHRTVLPVVDYSSSLVEVAGCKLPLRLEDDGTVRVSSLGVKKFASLLRKRRNCDDLEVFSLVEASALQNNNTKTNDKTEDSELEAILGSYKEVFREDLPAGLPPQRDVDHAIKTDPEAKPAQLGLYQLSGGAVGCEGLFDGSVEEKEDTKKQIPIWGLPVLFKGQRKASCCG